MQCDNDDDDDYDKLSYLVGQKCSSDVTLAGAAQSRGSPSLAHDDNNPPQVFQKAGPWPPSMVDLGTHPHDVLKDQSHAPHGGDVGQRWEDGQHLEVLDKHQQDYEGQDDDHVQANVQEGCQHRHLPGLAGVGGHVGFLHHLT